MSKTAKFNRRKLNPEVTNRENSMLLARIKGLDVQDRDTSLNRALNETLKAMCLKAKKVKKSVSWWGRNLYESRLNLR